MVDLYNSLYKKGPFRYILKNASKIFLHVNVGYSQILDRSKNWVHAKKWGHEKSGKPNQVRINTQTWPGFRECLKMWNNLVCLAYKYI